MRHEHLPADVVADHLEGLLDRREAAYAERHLAACPECSALRADLVGVRAALASASTGPMPPSVAARIDAALAQAATQRAAGNQPVAGAVESPRDHAVGGDIASVSPEAQPARRRAGSIPRRRRWLPALGTAVATIAVVAGAAAVLAQLGPSSDNTSGGTGVAAREGVTSTGDAPGAAAQGDSGAPAPTTGLGPSDRLDIAGGSGGGPAGTVLRSGRAYTAYTLSEGVRELLAQAGPSTETGAGAEAPGGAVAGGSGDPLARLASQQALAECIRAVAGRAIPPMVVDLATYGGKPAAIIVLPDPADTTNAIVYVVGADCGTGASARPIAVTTVRRPVTISPPAGTPPSPSATTPSAATSP